MAVYCVLTWTGILPSCAQQSASTSIAASASQLPVDAQATLDQLQANLKAVRAAGDAAGEARILNNIGSVYSALGEHQKALEFYNQALPIRRAVGDRGGEAAILNNIAAVYSALGEKQKALDFFNQALPIGRAVGDRGGEATTLSNIGAVYSSLGEQQKALDFYNQALPVFRAVGDRGSEATILNNIGLVYDDLGEQQKALDFYNQALPIRRAVGDRGSEATTLSNIGAVYSSLGEKQKALDFYNQALPVFRAVGDRGSEATILNNIAAVYSALGEQQKALDFYNQALPVFRAVGDRGGEANALDSIGVVYSALGEKQKALDFYNQALPIATAVSDPLLESLIFNNMMSSQRGTQPALATFYGKEAVNLLQQVRGNIQGLDKELQSSFLASKDNYYHGLADLLIDQGRLPEAEQVLDLLKQQEYRDYTRGNQANVLGAATLTPAELQAEEDYQASTAQIVMLGQEWADLRKISKRTAAQDARLKVVSDQLDAANTGLSKYYARLYALLGEGSDANKQVADVKGDVSALKQVLAKMPHTVALYTMASKDGYRVIVITGSTQVAREYAIPQEELNQKVAALAAALEDYQNDAKAPALELYKILMGPVENDLEQAGADTLVWSLDGVLRYVPMAALFDGKQYMVEKYKMATITPVSIPRLSDTPDVSRLSVAGMGISQQYQTDLPELPSVVGELDHVVRDPQVKGAVGVLPGQVLLNDAFTEKAMEDELAGQHTVVHIASHFVFFPGGDDQQSYLLLADGTTKDKAFHLTVADFRDNQNLTLADTELLTLSACQTGMSAVASNGREVDGLGTTAQVKGAKAVISTLWDVADDSTGELMADFYRRWAGGGGKVEKVEALRQSQLDLLLGTGRKGGSQFANPYYWAPFVLMGNWK
jgi:CHAT domain-containing protein/Tfp pilus assembly protein PilF